MTLFGYFDSPDQTKPAFDPGLEIDCPFCDHELHNTTHASVKTISLMLEGDNRSYFYRAHEVCYDVAWLEQITAVESALIDAIASARNTN